MLMKLVCKFRIFILTMAERRWSLKRSTLRDWQISSNSGAIQLLSLTRLKRNLIAIDCVVIVVSTLSRWRIDSKKRTLRWVASVMWSGRVVRRLFKLTALYWPVGVVIPVASQADLPISGNDLTCLRRFNTMHILPSDLIFSMQFRWSYILIIPNGALYY